MPTAIFGADGDVNEMARQTVAALLVHIIKMQDVDDGLPCPVIVWISVQILFQGLLSTSVGFQPDLCHRVRKCYPDVLHQMLHFLMRPRTAEARQLLATFPAPQPGRCICTRNPLLWSDSIVRELHAPECRDPAREVFTSCLALEVIVPSFLTALGTTVESVFDGRSPRKVIRLAQSAVRSGQITPWPSCQNDVFPYGVKTSMSALCAWSAVHPETPILRTAVILHRAILTPAFPSVLLQTITPYAFFPMTAHYLKKCERALDLSRQGQKVRAAPLHSFFTLAKVYLDKIDELSNEEILAATGGDMHYVESLLDVCMQIRPVFRRMLDKKILTVHRELDEVSASFTSAILRLRALCGTRRIHFTDRSPLTPYAKFVAKGIICAHPECERTRFAVSAPLRRCGGCGLAYYCSVNCQARAWRHLALPHREVCGTLRRVFDLHDDCDEDRGVVDADLRRLKAENGVDVLRHLERLYGGR